jgi:hypothetical protein
MNNACSQIFQLAHALHRACTLLHSRSRSANGSFRVPASMWHRRHQQQSFRFAPPSQVYVCTTVQATQHTAQYNATQQISAQHTTVVPS